MLKSAFSCGFLVLKPLNYPQNSPSEYQRTPSGKASKFIQPHKELPLTQHLLYFIVKIAKLTKPNLYIHTNLIAFESFCLAYL